MSSEHLRFAPDILRRLGEELIPHPEQGLIELVRNAYDADARECSVELDGTDRSGGTVLVRDNGDGMGLDDIRSGWLVIGRSKKAAREPTRLGRLPVGDKGLGRLAALRMGSRAILETRPKETPGIEYQVSIDWDLFDRSETVEQVPISVTQRTTKKGFGTTISIEQLGQKLGRRETDRLARSLILLSDPFSDHVGFKASLVAPGFTDLERKVKKGYLEDAEFHLSATLDEQGRASARVFDWKGKTLWKAEHGELRDKKPIEPYHAPAATFELWAFLLDAKSFSKRSAKLGEVREWLAEVGGVHLYHRGLRVYPYGDRGHDWLDMNLARSRSPELRPSTNTAVGRIVVLDEKEQLLQKTDRTGFVENEGFANLRAFAIDALEWMARERLRVRESQRRTERRAASGEVRRAKTTVEEAVQKAPTAARVAIQEAVKQLDQARERETRALRQEVELYRTLGTVGTTMAVFAHESTKPVSQIEKMVKVIEERGKQSLEARYADLLERPVSIVLRSAQALKTFANVPMRLLEGNKRKSARVDVHAVINETVALFKPFLDDAKIVPKPEFVERSPMVWGTVAALQGILANLLTNSINAFSAPSGRLEERVIVFRTEITTDRLVLRVLDNGPGIDSSIIDDIWLPGFTTTPGGTGLGLVIVRDTVTDLEGTVSVVGNGVYGGAEFVIEFPMLTAES